MGKENKNIGKNRKNKHCGTTGLLHKKEIPRSDLIKRERCAIKSWNEDIDNKGSEQRQHPGFVFSTAIYWRGGRTNQYWPCLPLHCRSPVQISKGELMNEKFKEFGMRLKLKKTLFYDENKDPPFALCWLCMENYYGNAAAI